MPRRFNVDASDAIRKLSALGRRLEGSQVKLALARAINRVGAMSKTQASAEIRREYKIKKSILDKKLKFVKASRYRPVGKITSWGSPIAIYDFRPRQTKKGVSVNVSGTRKLIPHAFIQTVRRGAKNEHKSVFMRGRYGPTGFVYQSGKYRRRYNRMNFKKLVTVSQGVMFSKPVVIEKTLDTVEKLLEKRFEHEMLVLLAGIVKS